MRFFGRLALIALALTAILVFCAGIAVLMRNEIAEGIILREFASRGINAELQVVHLTWNEIVIEDLKVEEARIARLQLSYSLRELMNGQMRAATIEGLTANIDFTGDGPPLRRLQNLFPETSTRTAPGGAAQTPMPALPPITIADARITFILPDRVILLRARGDLQPHDGRSEISLSFEGESSPFLASGNLGATLNETMITSLTMEIKLNDEGRSLAFTLDGQSDSLDSNEPELQLRLGGEGELATLAAYAGLDETQTPQTGTFRLNTEGVLRIRIGSESPLESVQSETAFSLSLSSVTLPNPGSLPAWMLDRINAEISGTMTLQQASITSTLTARINYPERETRFEFSTPDARATLNEDYSLRSADLTAFVASATSLPTPYGMLRTLRLEGDLSDLLTAPSGALQIHATSPEVTLAAVSASNAVIDARASLSSTEEGYRLAFNAPAQYSFGALHLPALLPIEELRGQVLAANLDLIVGEDGYSFRQTAEIDLPNLSIDIERQDAPPLALQLESGAVDFEAVGIFGEPVRFTLAAMVRALGIAELGILAEDAEVSVEGIVGGQVRARVHGGSVTHAVESPLYTPLTPDFQIVHNGNHLSIRGNLSGANDLLVVSVQGEHDLATRRGNVRFAVDELVFGPGGATGIAISPLLASLDNLRGQMSGEASFRWSEAGFDSNGRVGMEQMSFRRTGMTIEGLATELTLDRLLPLRSPPNQHLTIRRIETGIEDLTSVDLRFELDTSEEGTPRVYTETLSMDIAGGRITAEGGTIDPATGESNITLQAENLDLARLLSHIGLEELTGEGQLNGTIPFRIGENGASIEGAVIRTGSAGVVAYRSERAREALASGGDAVNLMLDALEDFHYDSLDLNLSKPVAGDTEIKLRMQGNNPAVLEGHPFDINISLTGDADPLLQAILAGQQLSNELLRSMTSQ